MRAARIGPLTPRRNSCWRPFVGWVLLAVCAITAREKAFARACVWKVSSGSHTLYLAGSVHALRSSDYPLPAAYEQAFQASSKLAFEADLSKSNGQGFLLEKAAYLPKGSTLRDHLDPRVYDYLLRVIANVHGSTEPEKKLQNLKPWAVAWLLQTPHGIAGVSSEEGVEAYLLHKAVQAHKETTGLVSMDEHIAVFGGMSDADGQAYLLLSFIQLDQQSKAYQQTVRQWKHGDIEAIDRSFQREYRDTPVLLKRIIGDRNRRWLPEIIQWLGSGKTYMVVAGAGHMAGSEGLPALLRAQGFQVEQL